MDDATYIEFDCPHCNRSLEYDVEFAGSAQPCPHCGQDLVVPGEDSETAGAVPLPFETPRLIIRRLTAADLFDVHGILSDPDAFRFETEAAHEDEATTERWLKVECKAQFTDTRGRVLLAIELKADEKVIGLLNFAYHANDRHQAWLGIKINRDFHRRGYGFEAFRATLLFCCRKMGLHRVTAACDKRNSAGVKLLTKCGMRREGEFIKSLFIDGEWADSLNFAMLQEEATK